MKGLVICVGLGLLLAACYGPPAFSGPFRCGEGGACSDGLVCDDGVCCSALGQPRCRSLVLEGGSCADGGFPQRYFEDLDGDGFGSESSSKLYCARPVFDAYVAQGGDCNDTPEIGKLNHPGAEEICDGVDNDCDKTPDDGLSLKVFYEDQDNDSFGDPARPVSLCVAPLGYVNNSGDCAPEDGTRNPRSTEVCNAQDDDCDTAVDEAPLQGTGVDCPDVPGAKGVCKAGKTACVAGALVCQQTVSPKPDVCDLLDNNCDGAVDEQPDCGGSPDFLSPTAGLLLQGQNTNQTSSGQPANCLKDTSGASFDSFANPAWSGSGATAHIAYAQSAGTWDLSRSGTRLRLKFSWSMVNPGSPAWSGFAQPVVLLCGDSGHVRFVHSPSLLGGAGGSLDTFIPVGGGNGWVNGTGSGMDLTQVKRVEVMIHPAYAGATAPQFTVTFLDWGFSVP